jgi:hypothetical protein
MRGAKLPLEFVPVALKEISFEVPRVRRREGDLRCFLGVAVDIERDSRN